MRLFSVHKHRHVIKPMMVLNTTGYNMSVMGPNVGKSNDASILNHVVAENVKEFRAWLREDDVAVVDRGFRYSIDILKICVNIQLPNKLMSHITCPVHKTRVNKSFPGHRCANSDVLVPGQGEQAV